MSPTDYLAAATIALVLCVLCFVLDSTDCDGIVAQVRAILRGRS